MLVSGGGETVINWIYGVFRVVFSGLFSEEDGWKKEREKEGESRCEDVVEWWRKRIN